MSEEELVWFVPEDLMQPYAVVVLKAVVSRKVAATKITIPVDKNSGYIIVLLRLSISAYLLCFFRTLLCVL